jgi:hypothetical protein
MSVVENRKPKLLDRMQLELAGEIMDRMVTMAPKYISRGQLFKELQPAILNLKQRGYSEVEIVRNLEDVVPGITVNELRARLKSAQ